MCLFDLEDDIQTLSILVRPSSLEQIKKSLQEDDDVVKCHCFKLILNLLKRAFDSEAKNEFDNMSGGFFSAAASN